MSAYGREGNNTDHRSTGYNSYGLGRIDRDTQDLRMSLYDVEASHEQAWCYAQLREHSENNVLADLSIVNSSKELVAQLEGFRLRPITQQGLEASLQRATTHGDGNSIPGSLPGPMDGIDKAAGGVGNRGKCADHPCRA